MIPSYTFYFHGYISVAVVTVYLMMASTWISVVEVDRHQPKQVREAFVKGDWVEETLRSAADAASPGVRAPAPVTAVPPAPQEPPPKQARISEDLPGQLLEAGRNRGIFMFLHVFSWVFMVFSRKFAVFGRISGRFRRCGVDCGR